MTAEVPTLVGAEVRLRPVQLADLPLFVRWYNSPEIRHWFSNPAHVEHTIASETQLWEHAQDDDTQRDWIIETLDGTAIGNAGLNHINRARGHADFFIQIGETGNWSRGYGTAAVRLVVREAFEGLGLNRIALYTDIDNARAQRCYEKCGFVREGVLRDHSTRDGQPLDSVLMAILRRDWNSATDAHR